MRLTRHFALFAWLAFLVTFLALSLATTACQPSMEPRGSIDAVDQKVALAFSSARVVLVGLDTAEVFYLDEGTRIGKFHGEDDPLLAASARRIAALQSVRKLLERVREHLSGDVQSDLKQAFVDLKTLLLEAKTVGVRVPPDAFEALAVMEKLL